MNIDFHVHITPPDIIANWEKYAQREPYFSQLNHSNSALKKSSAQTCIASGRFATAEDVIAELEKEGSVFDKAVVFGFAFCDMGLCRYVNDYIIEKTSQYPHRLLGLCVVPPLSHEGAAREIERCCNDGLIGVGELFPLGQGFDLENIKETAAVTEACREFDIPLLLHTNEPVGHSYPGKTDISLRQIETFVTNNSALKIVLAHWGGGLLFYETMPEIKKSFCNVYYDTAASPFLYDERIYRAVKALGLCEKILFGSDFPLLPPSRYLNALEKSGLTAEEKQLILGANAENLLKLCTDFK